MSGRLKSPMSKSEPRKERIGEKKSNNSRLSILWGKVNTTQQICRRGVQLDHNQFNVRSTKHKGGRYTGRARQQLGHPVQCGVSPYYKLDSRISVLEVIPESQVSVTAITSKDLQ